MKRFSSTPPALCGGALGTGFCSTDHLFYNALPPLAALQEEIQHYFMALGFDSFSYDGISMFSSFTPEDKNSLFPIVGSGNRTHRIATLDNRLITEYFQALAPDYRIWPHILSSRRLFIRPAPDLQDTRQRDIHTFWNDHRIHSQLFINMQEMTGDTWHCTFILNSRLTNEALERHIEEHREAILMGCHYYHNLLMLGYRDYFNPWRASGVISDRAIEVLQLAGEGQSSKYIAKVTGLSEKGVNYHLDQLRELLGANNRVNLIARAKDMKLI